MNSLRWNLTVRVAAATSLLFLVIGLLMLVLLEWQLWRNFDYGISDRVIQLSQLIEWDGQQVDLEWDTSGTNLANSDELVLCYQDGQLIYSLPTEIPKEVETASFSSEQMRTLHTDHGKYRALSLNFQPHRENGVGTAAPLVTLIVGRTTSSLENTIHLIRWIIGGGVLLTVTAVVLASWWSVGTGLLPLKVVADNISQIQPDSANWRPAVQVTCPIELQPLVTTINNLIERLQRALERERAFSGEIAHELKTPLSGILSKCDLALARKREPDQLIQTIQDCRRIASHAASMTDSLLATMEPDTDSHRKLKSTVQLSHELESQVINMEDHWQTRDLTILPKVMPGISIVGSPARVRMIVRNLLENVASHADAASSVNIQLDESPERIRLNISNQCKDFPADKIQLVFERFWRADGARSQSDLHSGLGLSLLHRLVTLEGATVHATYEDSLFTITIEWPTTQVLPNCP